LIPAAIVPAIRKAVEDSLSSGPLLGFPVTDIRVILVGGSYHEEESTEQAFGVAANMAFRKAALAAHPVLLEPVMSLEVTLPDSYLGEVIADSNSRRAKIMGTDSREGGLQIVRAHAPLAEMFGYSTDLRSATQGRASFTMQFLQYERVPDHIATKIIQRVRGEI